jgi:hypothetical protein
MSMKMALADDFTFSELRKIGKLRPKVELLNDRPPHRLFELSASLSRELFLMTANVRTE